MAKNTQSRSFSIEHGLIEQLESMGFNKSQIVNDFLKSFVEQELSEKEQIKKKLDELIQERKNLDAQIGFYKKQLDKLEREEQERADFIEKMSKRKQQIYDILAKRLPELYNNAKVLDSGQLSFGQYHVMLKDMGQQGVDTLQVREFIKQKLDNNEDIQESEIMQLCNNMFNGEGVQA